MACADEYDPVFNLLGCEGFDLLPPAPLVAYPAGPRLAPVPAPAPNSEYAKLTLPTCSRARKRGVPGPVPAPKPARVLLANRNVGRKRSCPSCGESVSTNGFNFAFHMQRCNPDMARVVCPGILSKCQHNAADRVLKHAGSRAVLEFKGVSEGGEFVAVVKVGAPSELGHTVQITAVDGQTFLGFVFTAASEAAAKAATSGGEAYGM
jgi:hypothetical protein